MGNMGAGVPKYKQDGDHLVVPHLDLRREAKNKEIWGLFIDLVKSIGFAADGIKNFERNQNIQSYMK